MLFAACDLRTVDRSDYSTYSTYISDHCSKHNGTLTTHVNTSDLLYCECVEGNLTTSLLLNYNTTEYFIDRYFEDRKKDSRLIAYEVFR